MDCCEPTACEVTVAVDCPRCAQRGRKVGEATLDALLVEPTARTAGTWRFCRTSDCPVAYFHEGGAQLEADAVRPRIGQKEHSADRPICYCFGHSAADLVERPGIQDEIKAACKRGEDRCPQTNPQGSCCLGNVAAVLRENVAKVSA